jgi:hypothetical protein
MKLAVLIYGQYRQFDIAFKSWTFLHELDCDVYVSTWNRSSEVIDNMGINVDFNVTEELFTRYVPNAVIDILDENDYPELNKPLTPVLHTHWRNLSRMLKESNKDYDSVILLRTDIFLGINFPITEFYKFNEPNTLYSFNKIELLGNKSLFCNDVLFCGHPTTIMNFIDTLPDDCDYHTKLGEHVYNSNLYVKATYNSDQFRYSFIRPNCRAIPTNDLNETIIFNLWEVYETYIKDKTKYVDYKINITSL